MQSFHIQFLNNGKQSTRVASKKMGSYSSFHTTTYLLFTRLFSGQVSKKNPNFNYRHKRNEPPDQVSFLYTIFSWLFCFEWQKIKASLTIDRGIHSKPSILYQFFCHAKSTLSVTLRLTKGFSLFHIILS